MSVQLNPETSSPRFTTAKKCLNTTGAIAGAGATGALLLRGIYNADEVCTNRLAAMSEYKTPLIKPGKVYRFFEKMGQKLFKDTELGKIITHNGICNEFESTTGNQVNKIRMTKYGTIGAMALTAGVAGLAIIAKACHNIGKLDGKQQ